MYCAGQQNIQDETDVPATLTSCYLKHHTTHISCSCDHRIALRHDDSDSNSNSHDNVIMAPTL